MNGHELLALLSALKPEELDVSVQVDIQEYVGVNSLTFLPGDGHDDSDDGKGILLLDVGVQGVG